MSKVLNSESYQVIWLVRRLFRALGQRSNENLGAYGITAADRAVMEFLYPDKTLSVPQIAEQYQVSRQHIQATVNTLLEAELLETKNNPRHKRSPMILLNTKGRKLFAEIMKKDEEVIEILFSQISKKNIRITQQTLQSLLNKLS